MQTSHAMRSLLKDEKKEEVVVLPLPKKESYDWFDDVNEAVRVIDQVHDIFFLLKDRNVEYILGDEEWKEFLKVNRLVNRFISTYSNLLPSRVTLVKPESIGQMLQEGKG